MWFEFIRDSLPKEAYLNTTTTNKHVSEIECKNCVIKEREGSLLSNLTFNKIPGRIIIELIRFLEIWLNQ